MDYTPFTFSDARHRHRAADRTFVDETRAVTAKDSIDVAVRGRGGFVMRVVPQRAGRARE